MEVDAACLHAFLAQLGSQAVEGQDFVLVVARTAFDHGLHLFIGVSAARLDDGLANPLVVDLGIVVHLEDYAESQFLLVGTERADIVAELLGEHGDGAVDEVDACATVEGFFVDGGAFLHIVRHIGDVDTHLPVAVFHLLQADGIVEVLGVGRVDGDGEGLAEVTAFLDFGVTDFYRNLCGLTLHLFRKLDRIVMGSEDGFHLHIVLAGLAEHADNLTEGVARAVGPVGKVDDDLHAVLGAFEVASWDEDVDRHPLHIGTDEDVAVGDGEHAHKLGVAAFEHLHDFAFGLAVVTLGKHGHAHAVAVKCLAGVGSGDEDVLTVAIVAHHIGLARRLHLHRTLHILRLGAELRHALRTHHIAIGTHLLQQAFVLQVDEQVIHHILARLVLNTHDLADLLVVFRAEGFVGEDAENHTRESAEFVFYFFLFWHN